ncbi:ribulose bisphosphate carboxylase small subunit [Vulcanimicrobium alpinum]|uniref:Ribulose bisphosphate carboxylase small subunit n=1 Tax=Vulcanimicrobium alpinum TaxID=3016050 RepID=A0AAN2CA47_UNVUL|nr:ribulose bisphosphate carboxylase small subunit [Vulcanimicrobium alpinum]BDE06282.1 ribulose bisphosphate carboxylase small subunit [Vulcanimicrobium alpinum]
MRITQGTFSYLPDLTDEQIGKQIQYAIDNRWAVSIEYTTDPHPRNTYWELHGIPLFDVNDASVVVRELNAAREAYPRRYIRISAYDATRGRETTALSFIVQRPANEPGFRLERQSAGGRTEKFTLSSYATERPEGTRYAD